MKEAFGNLWDYPADWRVITTNGFVKNNGQAVMGRGCAKEAATKYVTLPVELGSLLKRHGNHLFVLMQYKLITFPVKHNWWEKADLKLISQSAAELFELNFNNVVMPRAGCGNGQLSWEEVKPILEYLPDSITVITNGQLGR